MYDTVDPDGTGTIGQEDFLHMSENPVRSGAGERNSHSVPCRFRNLLKKPFLLHNAKNSVGGPFRLRCDRRGAQASDYPGVGAAASTLQKGAAVS